jgi:YD repeat-containing protein
MAWERGGWVRRKAATHVAPATAFISGVERAENFWTMPTVRAVRLLCGWFLLGGALIGAAAPTIATDSRLTDNPRTETVYDLAGRVTDTYDELRRRTTTVYFPDGTPDASRRRQMVQHRTAGNLVTSYQYDKAGNIRFVTDPRGNQTETR